MKTQSRILLFDRWLATLPREAVVSLRNLPVILADNVAEYRHASERTLHFADPSDFPNVAPPFPDFWIEFNYSDGNRIAVWMHAEDCSEIKGELPRTETGENPRWHMQCRIMVAADGGIVCAPFDFNMFLSKNGTPLRFLNILDQWGCIHGFPWDVEEAAGILKSVPDLGSAVTSPIGIALLTLCFMNCKNVAVEKREPDAKLSRAFQRRHGTPLTRYHVLDIDPMRKILKDEGGSETTGLKQALHICRGHFKTYTAERPLLGKTTGTFWWPMHVRGTTEAGVSVKDYRVLAPKE